jgi:hypothetical protein
MVHAHNPLFRASGSGNRIALFALLIVAALLLPLNHYQCRAQSATEYQVKAAYLFNFLKFVEWPEDPPVDPQAKWVIGIVGESPVGAALAHLAEGKNVLGRELLIRKLQATDNLRGCNILFISESEKKALPAILTSLRGSSVMTVADMDKFVQSGGMVQLDMEDARVRVTIDVGATDRAHLKVSSKLLALARSVTATVKKTDN